MGKHIGQTPLIILNLRKQISTFDHVRGFGGMIVEIWRQKRTITERKERKRRRKMLSQS